MRSAAPSFDSAQRSGEVGWIAGDLHLENFGAFRSEALADEDQRGEGKRAEVCFHINDFDDALRAPLRLDLLRLCTSVLLARQVLGSDGREALALCRCLLDAYVASACFGAEPAPPPSIRRLCERVGERTRKDLLVGRVETHKGGLRFVRGPRYLPLPDRLVDPARRAFEAYAAAQEAPERSAGKLEVLDLALRVAGTGSLGALRVAVLTRGRGGEHGGWIFDMKEQGAPSAAALGEASPLGPAERVLAAMRACLPRPPHQVGVSALGDTPVLVRRLTPQEDRLDLARLPKEELTPLCAYLGALVASAHRRGCGSGALAPWSPAERDTLVEHAVVLAGVHESAYLAYCQLTAPRPQP